jgi:hypothetical protein
VLVLVLVLVLLLLPPLNVVVVAEVSTTRMVLFRSRVVRNEPAAG